MNMKRSLSVMLSFILISLTACGNENNSSNAVSESNSETIIDATGTEEVEEVAEEEIDPEDLLPIIINNTEDELAKYDYFQCLYGDHAAIAIKLEEEPSFYYIYYGISEKTDSVSWDEVDIYSFQCICVGVNLELPLVMTEDELVEAAKKNPEKYHCTYYYPTDDPSNKSSSGVHAFYYINGEDSYEKIIYSYDQMPDDPSHYTIDFQPKVNWFALDYAVVGSYEGDGGIITYMNVGTSEIEDVLTEEEWQSIPSYPDSGAFVSKSICSWEFDPEASSYTGDPVNYIYDPDNETMVYKNEELGIEIPYITDNYTDFVLDPVASHVNTYTLLEPEE